MRLSRLVRPLVAGCLAVALAASLTACAPESSEALLMYRVTALDGSAPTRQDMVNGRGRLEVRLLAAGYERNDVSIIPPDRLRVVLPENAAGKLPQIRVLLEDPEDLPVRVEELPR